LRCPSGPATVNHQERCWECHSGIRRISGMLHHRSWLTRGGVPSVGPSGPSVRAGATQEILGADQDLARLGAVTRSDDAVLLHEVDEARGFRVAEAHSTLDEADRRLLLADDQLDRAPVDVVTVVLAAASVHASLLADRLDEPFLEDRLALLLEEAYDVADLR